MVALPDCAAAIRDSRSPTICAGGFVEDEVVDAAPAVVVAVAALVVALVALGVVAALAVPSMFCRSVWNAVAALSIPVELPEATEFKRLVKS